MFKKAWDHRLLQGKAIAQGIKRDLATLDVQIENLLDRIVDANSASVVTAYEKRLAKLEKQRLILEEKQAIAGKPKGAFEDVFELALRFFSNPHKLWESGRFECQKLVLKLAFNDTLAYCRNEGFRTPQVAVPFRFFGNFTEINKMAEREGFEPSVRLPAQRFSRPPRSTTPAPLQTTGMIAWQAGNQTGGIANRVGEGKSKIGAPCPGARTFRHQAPAFSFLLVSPGLAENRRPFSGPGWPSSPDGGIEPEIH